MNKILSNVRPHSFNTDVTTFQHWNVDRIRKHYNLITLCVDKYNEIFGLHFITHYSNNVLHLLIPINFALIDATSSSGGSSDLFFAVCFYLIWTCIAMVSMNQHQHRNHLIQNISLKLQMLTQL